MKFKHTGKNRPSRYQSTADGNAQTKGAEITDKSDKDRKDAATH